MMRRSVSVTTLALCGFLWTLPVAATIEGGSASQRAVRNPVFEAPNVSLVESLRPASDMPAESAGDTAALPVDVPGMPVEKPADESDTPARPADDSDTPINYDAETGSADQWVVFDAVPAGASVSIQNDPIRGSKVYRTRGKGRKNGFSIGAMTAKDGGWNALAPLFGFSMRTASYFDYTLVVDTTAGQRWLNYNQSNASSLLHPNGFLIHHGLGSALMDDDWHTIERDLQADISAAEPGNKLLAVQGFAVRGELAIDDIRLYKTPIKVDAPPTAGFTADFAADSAKVTFTSTSTDDKGIVKYIWDFGDGVAPVSSGKAESVSYIYRNVGVYEVTLGVIDTAGQRDLSSVTVVIDSLDGTGNGLDDDSDDGMDDDSDDGMDDDSDDGMDDGSDDGMDTDTSGPGVSEEEKEAARLLTQATFGVTEEGIAEVIDRGVEDWIDHQLGLRYQPMLPYVRANSNGSNTQARHDIWWRRVVESEDQLRQRMTFALSQLFVISDVGYTLSNAQYGVTDYYDTLAEGAFGNYRDLLENVTLHPVMGVYLSSLQNEQADEARQTRADENFAREVLQLFSIGPHRLNIDGTVVTAGGRGIPVYTQQDIENYARVFTGWNFAGADRWNLSPISSDADKVSPMEPWEEYHDSNAKQLLNGVTVPAGGSARDDLEIALDSIANHPNVGPFIASHLIRQLVTSNPSRGYVARVAQVFNNNGAGERGDLGAVVKAILLDSEARSGHLSNPQFGKLREPVLRLSHLWRAFDITPGSESENGNYNTASPYLRNLEQVASQAVLRAPSVFNFYSPSHQPIGPVRDAGLVAPVAEIMTDDAVIEFTRMINRQIQYHNDFGNDNARRWSYLVFDDEREAAAESTGSLLDRLDLLLLSGSMSAELRDVLASHIESLPSADTEDGQNRRVIDTVLLIMSSPDYLVQR